LALVSQKQLKRGQILFVPGEVFWGVFCPDGQSGRRKFILSRFTELASGTPGSLLRLLDRRSSTLNLLYRMLIPIILLL
jgi:hypothetical protein